MFVHDSINRDKLFRGKIQIVGTHYNYNIYAVRLNNVYILYIYIYIKRIYYNYEHTFTDFYSTVTSDIA